jgi:lipoprotein-anchoring transpeptidase ErfK/SrfK
LQARSPVGEAALHWQPVSPDEAQAYQENIAPGRRSRRSRLPAIILFTAALGLIAVGAAAFFLLPPETLAVWLPVPARSSSAPISPAVVEGLPAGWPGDKVENSAVDSLPLAAVPGQEEPAPVDTSTTLLGDTLAEAQVVVESAPAEAPFLIGPLISADTSEPAPVDESILAYQPAYPGEKWIEVNVTTQQVTAWEGNVPVMTFVASTGLPSTPTILGEYHIYWKLKSALMVGPNYYLPDVPYTMYFYGGYALHGTYWHSNFGQPMSHGCVNLSSDDAQKLFEWAGPLIPEGQNQVTATSDNPGTLVVVHQ